MSWEHPDDREEREAREELEQEWTEHDERLAERDRREQQHPRPGNGPAQRRLRYLSVMYRRAHLLAHLRHVERRLIEMTAPAIVRG